MLDQKYFEIPLWVWLIIISIILYSVYCTSCKKINTVSAQKINQEMIQEVSKEKFANSDTLPNMVVYNFNTSWCGWSKKFQPEWNKFSEENSKQKINKKFNIKALDIKCDDNEENIKLSNKYNVPGYPYIVIDIDGKNPMVYTGERTSSALLNFIKEL